MPQTTFDMDAKTLESINDLKKKFNLRTNSQVLRRALALAKIAAEASGEDGYVTIADKNGQHATTVFVAD